MNESTGAKKLSGLAPLKEMLLYLSAFPISYRDCGENEILATLRLGEKN
jgi:hypothetical protein